MHKQGSVERLLAAWREETGPAGRRALLALFAAAVIGAVLLGRTGVPWSRPAALAVVLLGGAPIVVARRRQRQEDRDVRAAVAATILRTEPDVGLAALRALGLRDRALAGGDVGSPELVGLHLSRVLGRASEGLVAKRGARVAWRWSLGGAALALACFGVVAFEPARIVEGLDVLAASTGRAPLALVWTRDTSVVAEPPSYLDREREMLSAQAEAVLPVGTRITVGAVPLRRGRSLVLSDGRGEVPFVDDGNGGVVAHYTVTADASLTVAARFGAVLVPEPRSLGIDAIGDPAPVVRLEGAPATKRLVLEPRITLRWSAEDEHALREIALVLRAGEKEERRVLSKPEGGTRKERGGLELFASDRFIAASHVPIEVSVEALDDDAVTGPKWGRSAAFVLVPPAVGELELLRYRALAHARDALTELLGARLDAARRGRGTERSEASDEAQQARALGVLKAAIKASYGGLHVPGKIAALGRGQTERLDKALGEARRGGRARGALVLASENAVLAIDAVLEALGARDTRTCALLLSDVASEAAVAIKAGAEQGERERSERRAAAALEVLSKGGTNLLGLGELGLDLGEIVASGVRRIERALAAGDRHHARLAAEDLAARLRQPDPSFGSSGGGEGPGGVEAGGGGEGEDARPSEAASQAEGLDEALAELRRDHARERQAVAQALDEAVTHEQRDALKEELRQLAKEVRRAVDELPEQSSDAESARGQARAGRAAAEAMAGELERGELGEATDHGKQALKELAGAARTGQKAESGSREEEVGRAAKQARDELQARVASAEQRLESQRRQASEAAKAALGEAARRERSLAERARKLRRDSEASEAPLPDDMMKRLAEASLAMDQAGEELGGKRGHAGLERQDAAQRLLELAATPRDESDRGRTEGERGEMSRDAEVPPEKKDEAADRFRRRVTEGLGRKTPAHLRDAVRRYTEGLLR